MSAVSILGILVVGAFLLASLIAIKKHDRVLFRFCQIRRDLMKDLRDRYDTTLNQQEWQAAKFLLEKLNGVIQHYHSHKTTMFNLRKVRQMIKSDLQKYKETQQEIKARLPEVPKDTKVYELYGDFARASWQSFFTYTPFIRTEIILRLLFGGVAEQIVRIKRENLEERFA
ncbi:MAG: hypothetical protein R1F54_04700 [Candidatus Zeuxoniibacter abyssi]|nr:MAG: hypothetical protein R1F54_04700 [Candidatus Persebacteraceae bacterium AB1(2)]